MNSLKFIIFIVILIMSGLMKSSHSQVFLNINTPLTNKFSKEDIWNFSITNSSNQIERIYLLATTNLKSKGQILYARTMVLELLPGITSITEKSLNEINYKFLNDEFEQEIRNSGYFPEGTYKICISVFGVPNEIELGNSCINFTIEKNSEEEANTNTKKLPLGFSGYTEIFGIYADRPGYEQELPQNYAHINFSSTITLFELPFSGSILTSTLQSQRRQDINMYNLSFDAERFKNNLRKLAIQDVINKENANKLREIKDNSVIAELGNINQKLNHPQIQKELLQLEKIKELENKIQNTSDPKIKEKLIEELEKDSLILKKRNGYERLLKRKNDLEKLSVKYGNFSEFKNFNLNDLPTALKELDKLEQELESVEDTLIIKEIEAKLKRYEFIKNNRKKLEKIYGNKDRVLSIDINEIGDIDINDLPEILIKIDKLEKELTIVQDTIRKKDIEKTLKKYDFIRKNRKRFEKLYENRERFEKIKADYNKVGNIQAFGRVGMDELADPEYLKSKLISMGKLNKFEKVAYCINSFDIGTSFPDYSEFTLSNVPVSGFSTELNINKAYLAFTKGKLKKTVISIDPFYSSYERKIVAGSFGYGRSEGTHLHFHIVSIEDDSTSVPQQIITDTNSFNYYYSPQSNKILSSELRINILKDIVFIEGELAGSQTIGNKWLRPNNEIIVDSNIYNSFSSSGQWFNNILRQESPNLNTVVDYAYRIQLNTNIQLTKTRFELSTKRVGENFQSLGIPYLIRDVITYQLRVRQSLFKRKISLSGFVKSDGDNIEGNQVLTTKLMRFGFDAAIRINKLPYLRFNLTPVIYKNDSQSLKMNVFTITSGYQYKIGKLVNISNISYNRQKSEISFADWNYLTEYFTFNHVIRFKIPLALNASFNLINNQINDSSFQGYSIAFATNHSFKKWNNTLGFNTLINKQEEEKWGFFYQSSIGFARHFNFDLRIERNIYDNYLNREFFVDYKEILVKASLNIKW